MDFRGWWNDGWKIGGWKGRPRRNTVPAALRLSGVAGRCSSRRTVGEELACRCWTPSNTLSLTLLVLSSRYETILFRYLLPFFFLLLILLFENSLWLWPFLRVTRSNGIRENRWYVRFYLAFSSPSSWIPSVGTPGRGETVRRNRREKEKRELHASRKLEFRIGSSDYTANGSIFFRSFTFCRLTRMFRGSSLGNSRGKIVRGSWWALIHGLECPLSIRENSSFPFFFLFFSRIFLSPFAHFAKQNFLFVHFESIHIYIYFFDFHLFLSLPFHFFFLSCSLNID